MLYINFKMINKIFIIQLEDLTIENDQTYLSTVLICNLKKKLHFFTL